MVGSGRAFSYHLPFRARQIELFSSLDVVALVHGIREKKKKIRTVCADHQKVYIARPCGTDSEAQEVFADTRLCLFCGYRYCVIAFASLKYFIERSHWIKLSRSNDLGSGRDARGCCARFSRLHLRWLVA